MSIEIEHFLFVFNKKGDILSKFTDRLTELREKRGLSKQALADLLEINRVTYSNWELGKSQPNFVSLAQIAKLFGVSTDYLLGLTNVNSHQSNHEEKLNEFYKKRETLLQDFKNKFSGLLYQLMETHADNLLTQEEVDKFLRNTVNHINIFFDLNKEENYFEKEVQYWRRNYEHINKFDEDYVDELVTNPSIRNDSIKLGNNIETNNPKSDKLDDNEKY